MNSSSQQQMMQVPARRLIVNKLIEKVISFKLGRNGFKIMLKLFQVTGETVANNHVFESQ